MQWSCLQAPSSSLKEFWLSRNYFITYLVWDTTSQERSRLRLCDPSVGPRQWETQQGHVVPCMLSPSPWAAPGRRSFQKHHRQRSLARVILYPSDFPLLRIQESKWGRHGSALGCSGSWQPLDGQATLLWTHNFPTMGVTSLCWRKFTAVCFSPSLSSCFLTNKWIASATQQAYNCTQLPAAPLLPMGLQQHTAALRWSLIQFSDPMKSIWPTVSEPCSPWITPFGEPWSKTAAFLYSHGELCCLWGTQTRNLQLQSPCAISFPTHCHLTHFF